MPNMYDADDIVDLKNRKKRQKRLMRFAALIIVIIIAGALYATRDTWVPKLRGIGKQYKTIVNSGKLAEGNFPIEVSGGSDYQLRYTVKKILVQSDTYLYIYDTEGSLLKKRQHVYSNPILRVANGRALVYENGGNEFSVEDEEEVFYSRRMPNTIYFARLSSDGVTAVVTSSDNYSCELTVYDKKGNVIYERKCTEMVTDISFINKSGGCFMTSISAENGKLVTSVKEISFKEDGEKWTSPGLNTVGLEVFGSSVGAFVYGVDACGYVNNDGQISSFYQYDGEAVAGASIGGSSAVVINNEDRRRYIAALFPTEGEEPVIIELASPAVDVSVFKGLAYIMTQDSVMAYDFDGSLRSTAAVTDSYTGFVRSDDHIFLKGYNRIDRIDYDAGD